MDRTTVCAPRIIVLVTLVITALAAAMPLPVTAGELSFEAGVDLVSKYIWRGLEFDDDLSLQPSLTLTYAVSEETSVALNGWWNVALDDHGSPVWQDLLYEQDFTLSVSHTLSDTVAISGGYVYYSNPRSDVVAGSEAYQTDELYLGADLTFGKSSLATYLYYDFDLINSFYLDLAISHELLAKERLVLAAGAHLGIANEEVSWFADDGLVDGSVSVTADYKLSDHAGLGGSLNYARRFDDWQELTGNDDDSLWAGVSIVFSY